MVAPPTQDAYQIGWICALPVELAAAQQMLDENFGGLDVQDSTDTNSYVLGRIGKHYVVIAGLPGGQYGTTSATTVATNMLRTFSRSLRVGLMVGIGGGIPSADHDIRLGDIVVSYPQGTCGGVVQYDMGKVLEEGKIQRTGTLNSPPRSLLTAVSKMKADDMMMADDPSYLNYIETAIEKNAKTRKHFGRPDASTDRLFRIQHEHPANIATCGGCGKEWEEPRNMRKGPGPQVHYGIIASGNKVIKHGVTREQLRQETGALCFEMEAAGLMTDFPCIVIRGICDYADSHKNKEWQGYAALAAAAYAKQLLSYVPVTQISQEKSAADRRLPSFKHQGSGNIFNAKKIQNKSTGKGLMFSGAHITGPVTIEQHFGTQEPPQQLQDCSKSLDFRQIEVDSNSIDPATGQVIDPLSCLAVVAAVVPFIDFATHLLSDDCDIYHSVHEGTLNAFTMSTLATDLGLLYHNIAVQSNFLAHGHRFDGSIDSALIGISSTCKEICIQLHVVSEELDAKVYKKSLKPLGEAERAEKERQLPPKYQYHFQSQIDGLKKNFMVELGEHASEHTQSWLSVLISARRQVMRAAITTLWEPLNSTSEVGQRRVAVKAPAPWHTKNSVRILSQSFLKVIQKVVPNPDSITSLTMEEFSQPGMQSTRHRTVEDMEPSGQHIIWTMAGCDDGSCPFPIIQSLAFQGIHRREDTIPTAYMKTFDWIFTKPRVGANAQEQWSDYTSWLKGPTAKIYWITGKLGAGKSTLMKFLVEHNDVRKHLEHWSSQRQLVIASFYFWNTGDELQKSRTGLLRTLLRQILAQIPSITAKVCPRHWALCKTFGRQAIRLAPKWTWDELVESFSLLSDLIGVEFQLALFIDGLDEFDGDHGVLIDFIKHLRTRSGIKICVSSRHWNMFLDAFKSEPCLRVEDLTKADIETFVSGEFGRSVGFQELRINFPSKANQFVQDIVTKANGVFLWVSLVVRTLCEAFTNGDPLSSIQATLDELPSDLSELYERIWRSISSQYIRHSSQLFQIQYASTLPLHVITFWLADEDDHLEDDITVLRENGGNYVRDAIVRRLNSRTKGLLEVSSDSYVNYLHRSVKDWVEKEWSNICSESASNFDPHLCLLKALVIETADDELWDPRESVMATTTEEMFWGRVGVYFYHASLIRNQRPNFQLLAKVLQKLDCNLDKVCKVHRVAAPDTRGRHNVEHWSNQQRAGNSNTLLSFAAQCAVTPYVQFMVETNTKCFRLPASRQQILHAAIFGFEHFSHEAVLRWCGFNSKFAPLDSRLELVRFLCKSGICRENPSQMPRSSVERKIFEMVQEHNRSCVDEKEKSYWDDVEKLLQTNGAKKEKKPSRWKDKGLGLFKRRDDFSWDDEAMRGSPR